MLELSNGSVKLHPTVYGCGVLNDPALRAPAYQKTSSSTSGGSGEGLNTTNRRSLVLLSGGASFFRDGRLTSVWIRDIDGEGEKLCQEKCRRSCQSFPEEYV